MASPKSQNAESKSECGVKKSECGVKNSEWGKSGVWSGSRLRMNKGSPRCLPWADILGAVAPLQGMAGPCEQLGEERLKGLRQH